MASVPPEFDIDGDLPPRIHQATVDEIERRLGGFVVSDRRNLESGAVCALAPLWLIDPKKRESGANAQTAPHSK